MTQYYYTDGKERYGPFSIEQLQERNITPETLVWKEGMADWLPAKQLSELDLLLTPVESFPPTVTQPFVNNTTTELPPKNWLVESILITIFCCPFIFGVVALINATKVEKLWFSGHRDAALKASQDAGKWVKIGIFAGIACYFLYFLALLLGLVAGFGGGLSE